MSKRLFGNPNQPNFSYIPVTETSSRKELGPGYGEIQSKLSKVGVTSFSKVPRFGTPNSKKPPTKNGPTSSYIKKFKEWDALHFSRRKKKIENNKPDDDSSRVLSGSPTNM